MLDPLVHHTTGKKAFTLVELLVVIAVVSVLMTAGAIGINSLAGGKGVGSAVSQSEAIFHFARQAAIANNTRSRVLIAKAMSGAGERHPDDLRRIVVAIEDPDTNQWTLTDRGGFLPPNVFFSQSYSRTSEGGEIPSGTIAGLSAAFSGEFFFYEFNSEGVVSTPAAGFVVGNGAWPPGETGQPRVTRRGERDFSGFVIWRNGRTSLYRSPAQIPNLPEPVTTF